jgi:hypothetical protein
MNCTEYLTNGIVQNYLKGLAGSGSWLLFNKIESLEQSISILST